MLKNNRRNFLKLTAMAGVAGMIPSAATGAADPELLTDVVTQYGKHKQRFNMCGYAAPKLDTVRIGFIGIGGRGAAAVQRINHIDNVMINALADIRPEQVTEAKRKLAGTRHNPALYSGDKDAWKKLCERDDIDLVYVATHWALHTPVALYAMEHGKHVALEIPAAVTVEECWQLVETSERTRKHCTMQENCCYDFFEQLTLNMVRQGVFGDIVHCEGAYIHHILKGLFTKYNRWDMWRLKENAHRNGNLYPTHGLGPVAQVMNINRGDRFDYMVSMSGNDFMLGREAKEMAEKDDFFKPYVGKHFRGNMNTSLIRTALGKTIMLQHDVSSPRPYSRIHLISGTKGTALKYPLPGKISLDNTIDSNIGRWQTDEEMKELEKRYLPPIIKRIGEVAKQVGGHGGMDLIVDWRLIDCLRNGLPLDIDVYDAAAWSVIAPLSEWSVAHRSGPINIPDFTGGEWKTNKPVDILLEKGGNTKVSV